MFQSPPLSCQGGLAELFRFGESFKRQNSYRSWAARPLALRVVCHMAMAPSFVSEKKPSEKLLQALQYTDSIIVRFLT